MDKLIVKASRTDRAVRGHATGIYFRDGQGAGWLTSDGGITNRVVHAAAIWPGQPGHVTRQVFIAAKIARAWPGATVSVRRLGGGPVVTFTNDPKGTDR